MAKHLFNVLWFALKEKVSSMNRLSFESKLKFVVEEYAGGKGYGQTSEVISSNRHTLKLILD